MRGARASVFDLKRDHPCVTTFLVVRRYVWHRYLVVMFLNHKWGDLDGVCDGWRAQSDHREETRA